MKRLKESMNYISKMMMIFRKSILRNRGVDSIAQRT
jgi:hypothetical protein